MFFNSYVFIFAFLPVAWGGYFLLNRLKLVDVSKTWLLCASFFFYGYWDVHYFPLLLGSILINYSLAMQSLHDRHHHRRGLILKLGLGFNLGLLCYFKYTNFFLENVTHLTGLEFSVAKVLLPLGLSFYTLQQIAYLVDVYQGIAGEKRFLDYALFVSFFPHVISGPIVHHEETIPLFKSLRLKVLDRRNVSLGIFLFSIGLFKKVIIADTLSFWVNEAYRNTDKLHLISAWGTSFSYTFQLYFDFSGYSDMAVGLGYLFNVKLPQNFNSPFKAGNINDFWTRWHMTLTTFIRAYIFTPIVKCMKKPTFRNSMISMFLAMTIAGLWHGAAWTFVIYGMVHGAAIVIHHNWKKKKKKLSWALGTFLTFNFVNLTFVLFRSRNLTEAGNVFSAMLGLRGFQLPKMGIGFVKELGVKLGPYMTNDENLQLLMVVGSFVLIYRAKSSRQLEAEFEPSTRLALASAVLFVFSLFGMNRVSEFIYFNF